MPEVDLLCSSWRDSYGHIRIT